MKNKKSSFYLRFDEYTVKPADEATVQKTVEAGRQLILQSHAQRLSFTRRILNQIKYISPLLWGTELVVFAICVWIVSQTSVDSDITLVLSSLSFCVATLGIFGFPESCKSFSFQMWELEQSCKYNLRQILTLKLAILGTFFTLGILRDKESGWLLLTVGGAAIFLTMICVNRFSLYQAVSIPIWLIAYILTLAILAERTVQFLKSVEQGGMSLCS